MKTCEAATCCICHYHLNKKNILLTESTAASFSCHGTSPCIGGRDTEQEEMKVRGVIGQINTFLLGCILYWRQEYPSFYCTLIYYSETGDKASRVSISVYVCPQSSLLTPDPDSLSDLLKHYWVRDPPHTHTQLCLSPFVHCIDFSDIFFTSTRTSVHAVSCR